VTSQIQRMIAVAAVLVVGWASASELGIQAPPLTIREWVKGPAVSLEDGRGKTVYVVEFWATWCGPCKTTIPHLTAIQKKFADQGVVVVGITQEKDSALVHKFVDGMGEKMAYVVAMDDDSVTNKAYMEAFRAKGIPHAFVVDKTGAIVWQGHPMDGLDEVLGRIVAGTYDMKAHLEIEKAKKLLPVYGYMAANTNEEDLVEEIGRRIVKYGKNDAAVLHQLAMTIAEVEDSASRDLDLALQAIEAAHDLSEGKDAEIVEAYAHVLSLRGEEEKAAALRKNAQAAGAATGSP